VRSVSSTVLGPTEISIPGINVQEPVFRVRVSLDRDYVEAYGARIPMQAGMLLSADIVFDTMFAYQRSAALRSAIELDVFTAIARLAKAPGASAARGCSSPACAQTADASVRAKARTMARMGSTPGRRASYGRPQSASNRCW
jgi:hypothetical protein